MSLSQDDKNKLVKQVEFYFSDVNIQKDVFLKSKMAENAEGFVPLETLITFNRVGAITKDPKLLFDALQASEKLVLDEAALSVRRKDPLPESIQTDGETVYVKPVPPTATLEDLTAFFSKYGTVRAVWRRYFPGAASAEGGNRCKPSVFVVFGSREEAEKFKEEAPQYEGAQLAIQWKTEYLEAKAAEIAAKKKVKTSATAGGDGSERKATTAFKTPSMPRDSSYRITGCGAIEKFSEVKGLWPTEEQKGVRYVFTPDKETALVIFQDKETAEKLVEDVKKRGTTLNGKQPVIEKIEGEQEDELIANVEKEISTRAMQHAGSRGRGSGRGRGRGRGGMKRPRD